jgi:hypothetical protein
VSDFEDKYAGKKFRGGIQPEGTEKQVLSRRIITPEDTRQARADKKALSKTGGNVILVDENDPRYQAAVQGRRCDQCVEFDNEAALRAMKEQKFVERVVKDEQWRENWFKQYQDFGVCWAFSDGGGLRLNEPDAPGICARSDIDSTAPPGSEKGMEMVLCPYYENRKDRGKFASSSAAGVRGPTTRDAEARAYAQRHDARRRQGGKVR